MAITSEQNIPNKPIPNEPWTFRKLFSSGAGATTTLAKVFVNPLEVLLGTLITSIAIRELVGRHASIEFYALTFVMLAAVLFERHKGLFFKVEVPEEAKKDKK